jgi:lactoylglutathione lyase
MMQYGYTIIYVTSVPEILDFYKKAFGFNSKFLHPSNDYGELDTGDTTLAFANHDMGQKNLNGHYIKADANAKPLGMEVAFITDDVTAAYNQAITSGAVAIQQPIKKPWGQTVAYVKSIEGSIIELCSPVAAC